MDNRTHRKAQQTVMRLWLLTLGLAVCSSALMAQQVPAPPPATENTMPLAPLETPLPAPEALPADEQTPPILPQLVATPLPPPLELPPLPPDCTVNIPNHPLTADEAALIACHYQASLTTAQAQILIQRGQQQQVASGLGTQVAINSRLTQNFPGSTVVGNGANVSTGSGGTFSTTGVSTTITNVTVQQLLFDFSHTRELVRQAAALTQAAQANLTRAQSDLVFQVKQAFYQYVQNLRLVTVNEENVRNSQQHLALTRATVLAGTGLPSDLVAAQTALADAIQNLTVARNTAVTSRVLLAQLMGIDPRTPIVPAESVEPDIDTSDMNGLVAQALRRRPEIAQAEADIRAGTHGLKAAKTNNYPALFGVVGAGLSGTGFSQNTQTFNIGLSLHWVPIDAGLTRGLITQAQGTLLAAEADLCTVKEQVVTDVSLAYVNLVTARQRVTTAIAEVANAEERLRLAVGRYRAGVGIFLDVLDAQNALNTANASNVNARAALELARAALAHAMFANTVSCSPDQAPISMQVLK